MDIDSRSRSASLGGEPAVLDGDLHGRFLEQRHAQVLASTRGGRWIVRCKALLLVSRIDTIQAVHALSERLAGASRVLVTASAIGFTVTGSTVTK